MYDALFRFYSTADGLLYNTAVYGSRVMLHNFVVELVHE